MKGWQPGLMPPKPLVWANGVVFLMTVLAAVELAMFALVALRYRSISWEKRKDTRVENTAP